jgi:hypothetical protein
MSENGRSAMSNESQRAQGLFAKVDAGLSVIIHPIKER